MPDPLLQEPAAIFLAIVAVIFIAPLLSERARLPGIVGLILGGILIGRHGLHLLSVTPTIELFGAVGLIYLMFNAGLEIDLDQFAAVRNRAVTFSAISYLLPQISGILIGRAFDLGWPASVLLGAVYASQTLVAYPVLSRLGILRNEVVSVTVGATIFTDIASLLVLAVIQGSQSGSFSLLFLGRLVGLTLVYALIILLGVPRLGRIFFRYFTGNVVEFQFLLLVLFVAAAGAEWIGMHTIVGAFLVGLAVNETLSRESRVIEQVLFTGRSLFVPLFLMTVGMRLDPLAIVANRQTLLLGLSMTAAVYLTKLAAAWITARLFDYSREQMLTAWGLSQAQAAATLATILVGTEAGVFPEYVFNGAILMILVTSITSPLLVERFGSGLRPPKEEEKRPRFKRILVPITQDEPPERLLTLAARLARIGGGQLLALNLASGDEELKARRARLKSGPLQDPETEIEFLDRINEALPEGILKEAVESEASLIMLAWEEGEAESGRLFAGSVEDVVWKTKVPAAVGALKIPIKALERTLLVIGAHTVGVKLDENFIEMALDVNQALDLPLLVLTSDHYKERLDSALARRGVREEVEVVRLGQEIGAQVADLAGENDLIIMPSMGSEARFAADEGRVPQALALATKSCLLVLHFP